MVLREKVKEINMTGLEDMTLYRISILQVHDELATIEDNVEESSL